MSLDKLANKPSQFQNTVPQQSRVLLSHTTDPSSVCNLNQQSRKPLNTSPSNSSEDQHHTHQQFRVNDRVVVFDKKNAPCHGTVQWVGRHVQTRTLESKHIGIETVS